jgi:glycerophosphoryl diester phosphodiesterase
MKSPFSRTAAVLFLLFGLAGCNKSSDTAPPADVGERPLALIADMADSDLRSRLQSCQQGPFRRTAFSISHRGAPLGYPEHTREGYVAGARQGAGILECDVTFTSDRALVCRHAQCDLHTTTNMLETDLAGQCREPFTPADSESGAPASARCCTSDVTLAQLRTLCARHDMVDTTATSVADYLRDPVSREDAVACPAVMTHAESIALFDELGVAMTPELKGPEVSMPYQGDYRQTDYARQMIEEYRAAGIDPARVWPQSFNLADVEYWLDAHPEFARQAVYLDGRVNDDGFDVAHPERLSPTMTELAERGVNIIAPPLWALVTLEDDRIVPSAYARAARAAGLDIITWTLERSGSLTDGGGYYFQSVKQAINREGDVYRVLDVLAQDVGVIGVFSDWPATVTYYANCLNI